MMLPILDGGALHVGEPAAVRVRLTHVPDHAPGEFFGARAVEQKEDVAVGRFEQADADADLLLVADVGLDIGDVDEVDLGYLHLRLHPRHLAQMVGDGVPPSLAILLNNPSLRISIFRLMGVTRTLRVVSRLPT